MNFGLITIRICVGAVALWATVAPVFAESIWIAGTGNWFEPANWSAGVPGSTTSGSINNGGTAQIFASGATGGVTLGGGVGDSGNLVVSDGGRFDGRVDVGRSGSATLTITNGGIVTSGRFVIAENAGSTGTATVAGPGSTWSNSVICFVGYSGTATLNVTDGARVSDSSASIAETNKSRSMATVNGPGSRWTHSGTLTVGGDGVGRLFITNGGEVLTEASGGGFGSTIGRNPGSDGATTVTGARSIWRNQGGLSIGGGSAGTTGALYISDGASVSNTYGIVGGPGGRGQASVDGAGSTWTNNGNLYVAYYDRGAGVLTVTRGGKVSSVDGYIGPGLGTVEVDGPASTWTNSGNLAVGSDGGTAGRGILRVDNGGTVAAAATTVYGNGSLQLGNATLNGALSFRGGILEATGNVTVAKDFTLAAGGVQIQTAELNMTLSGSISGPGGLTKLAGSGGTLTLSGRNSYSGDTVVSGGTLLVNGSIASATTVSSGGTLGGSGTAGAVSVNSGGTVAPGSSPGRLTVNGNYNQNSGGKLAVELGGREPGTEFDQLLVAGQAQISGTLNAALVNGFRPRVGDTFQIVAADSVTGTFSTIESSGFTARSDANSRGIVLTVVAVDPPSSGPGLFGNISTRLRVETADEVLIAGFIIGGSEAKKVVVRAIGPSLGLAGQLDDPTLEVYDAGSSLVAFNDNWQDAVNAQEISQSQLAPTHDAESAALLTLPPGAYTTVVRGAGNTAGIGLVEAYDLARGVGSEFRNISTRGLVQTGGNVMIGGVIVVGESPIRIIIRAIGPSLELAGKLADPQLELFDAHGVMVAMNDNWRTDQEAEIEATTIPPKHDLESAIVHTLSPAGYTAIVRGAGDSRGVALVELYALE